MSKADEQASTNPILVMLDEETGDKYARAVGQKGVGQDGNMDWLIKDISLELKAWGHAGGESGHVILKTDGEPAITALRDAVAKYHGGKVVPEQPPRGESQSNGAVEEAGKTAREYARVLKEQLEAKTGVRLSGADIIVMWMIRWSAMLCSRFAVGRDGKTPYERRRGRRCAISVVPFGERVWYRELRQTKDRQDKMESEWRQGLWLGHARNSNEHLVGTREGVVKAYAIKRQPEDQRWDGELVSEMRGTPQQPDPARPGLAIPVRVHFDHTIADQPQAELPNGSRQIRRMRITAAILEQYGFTEDCEGCRYRRAGLWESRPHSETCRSRIEQAMNQNDEGRRVLEEQRQRINRRMAEQVEEAAEEPAIQEPRKDPERAQNAETGCSKSGARSEVENMANEGASDSEMTRPQDPVCPSDPGSAEGERSGGSHVSECPDMSSGSGRRSRSRSPRKAPEEFDIGTPGKGQSLSSGDAHLEEDDKMAPSSKRDAPFAESEPKRLRPAEGGRGISENGKRGHFVDADGDLRLCKLVTVGPHTKIHGDAPPQEEAGASWSAAWDDVSGEELDPEEVRKARALEMQYVEQRGVWRKVPRTLATRNGWKIIPTRWIDVNKGDRLQPNYRSRLVAKEYNNGAEEGLFAATPPLEALRLLLSDAATTEKGQGEKVVMLNDVARAFFEAPMKRQVCVELPAEALSDGETAAEIVGFLQLSLYGTRDAAANFQEEVRKFMQRAGFAQSRYSPQVYWHQARGLKTLVHGDDFVTVGHQESVHWLRGMMGKRFEIKSHVIGHGCDELREHRILGRIVRAAANGAWEYEADPRHAELIVKTLRLEAANGVRSPGEDERAWEAEENETPLQGAAASEYRALAARANYLAQDRADIQFAAKECCRGMAAPNRGHLKAIRRLARYMISVPRVVWVFRPQARPESLSVYSDSDWAGCRRTARSTSGGVIMLGSHCIRAYSVTQKFVTLSSGEAELMALVKATSEGIGLTQLAESWGIQLQANVFVDSSAALAVTHRKGCGKLRHVRIGHLWVQELAEEGTVAFSKVRGTQNPADLLTKHLPAGTRERLLPMIAQQAREGQAVSRLRLSCFRAIRPHGVQNPCVRGGVHEHGMVHSGYPP